MQYNAPMFELCNKPSTKFTFLFLVVSWGLTKSSAPAFRPAMALSTGELSSLGGKMILMTATATKKTLRVLKDQFPEVVKWKTILNLPARPNVTILVPPPELLSSKFEKTLVPFVELMRNKLETILIIVRGMMHRAWHITIEI